ncbi:hypothetical protein ACTA71_010549 [Dictyostelium dimigraforme]
MSLPTELINKLENRNKVLKQEQSKYDSELKEFLSSGTTDGNGNEDESISQCLKNAFKVDKGVKTSEDYFLDLPFILKIGEFFGESIEMVPKKSSFLFMYENLVLDKAEEMFTLILKTVETLLQKKLPEEVKEKFLENFKKIQTNGSSLYSRIKELFKRNGFNFGNSNYVVSDEEQSMTNELLLEKAQSEYQDYSTTCYELLKLSEPNDTLIITIGIHILISILLLSVQRDISIYGNNLGFSSSIISQVKSEILKNIEKSIVTTIKGGWNLTRHIYGNENFGFFIPPYFEGVRRINNLNYNMYPNGVYDHQRQIGNHIYEVPDHDGTHKIYPGFAIGSGFYPGAFCLTTGFKTMEAARPIIPFVLTIQFESAKIRKFFIKITDKIVRESRWTFKSGIVMGNLVYKENEYSGTFDSYLTSNETPLKNDLGYHVSNEIISHTKVVTLTCNRSDIEGLRSGYDVGSTLFMVELIYSNNNNKD